CILRAHSSFSISTRAFSSRQVMSIAQRVQHTFYRVIWLPMIVNDNSDDIRQETTAPGADPIEGQQGGGRNMQPLRLAADAKPGLVHVLHPRTGHEITHRFNKILKTFGASSAHSRDRRGGEFNLTPKRSAISAARRFSGSN